MDVIRAATQGRPAVAFPEPPGVVHVSIDPASGLLAYEGQTDAMDEVFVDGTQPTETAREAGVLDPSAFLMQQFDEEEAAADAGTAP
jgi:penicillin-binding protein 1A